MRDWFTVTKFLVPSWLSTGEGGGVLEALGALKNIALQKLRDGLEARFPSKAGPSALSLIGDDRGITRGRTELDAHYAQRLVRWRFPRGHRTRGSAFALLEQISEYFGGAIDCFTVDARSNRHDRTAAGDESFTYGVGWDWDTTGFTPNWARFWVFIKGSEIPITEQPDFGDAALWGGALGTPGYTIGQLGVTPEDVIAIRRLMRGKRRWKPAGTRAEWVIISVIDATPAPAGTHLHWGVLDSGSYVPARDPNFRYWSLTPEVNQEYGGNRDQFCLDFYGVGTVFAGDRDNFPATITLPGGATYAGNKDNFPATIRLLDDGDASP